MSLKMAFAKFKALIECARDYHKLAIPLEKIVQC